MKQQIANYFKDFSANFKQNPLQGSITLLMQIVFLVGWGMFYLILYSRFTTYIIPGKTFTKSDIYPETLFIVLITVIYSLFFYKFVKIMFSNHYPFKSKLWVILGSTICALLAYPLYLFIQELGFFFPETNTAFWATNI